MTPVEIYEHAETLRTFATDSDLRYLDALARNEGNQVRAAADLGVHRSTLRNALRNLAGRAARRGWSPPHDMTRTVPDPFVVRGVSTYYNKDGQAAGQWVKSRLDDQRVEVLLREIAAGMAEGLQRLDPVTPPKGPLADDLCNLFVLTDCHLGMLAWHKEGGADWDIKIAEATIRGAFERMLAMAPPAGKAVIAQIGDFLHWDGLEPVTPRSGNVVDADTRFTKVVRTAIRLLRGIVDLALSKFGEVVLLNEEGNHDIASSVWLRELFAALYENEPRLTVLDSPLPYHAIEHGNTMLGFHHGHLRRGESLCLLMAAQFPEIWGRTTKRYIHTGHRHAPEVSGHPGVRLIQHPTIAARDAFAARGGWLSERVASVITYHRDFGVLAENFVTPEMLS
mgnify:CR=1 FL=1